MQNMIIGFIRGALTVFCFGLFGVGALFIRYLIFPFQKNKTENYETLQKSWQFFIWLLQAITIIKLDIDDINRLKNLKNSIIISTHPSFIDIVILMSIIPHSTCFVAEKLSNNPFFKGMVDLLFILEGQEQEKWVKQACDMLDEGINIIIFPMGTRHKKNEFLKIRRGAALIAQKSGKDIEAVKIDTSFDFLANHQAIYDAGLEPVLYKINYIGKISTENYLQQFPDEVSFKTEVTKEIKKMLYS